MHEAVDLLDDALETTEPGEAYAVTQKALASAITVIARADDSIGIIGDAGTARASRRSSTAPGSPESATLPAAGGRT